MRPALFLFGENPAVAFVYVLWSESAERFYIGSTDDVQKRLQQHNQGLSRWTARHCPWRLLWQRQFPDRTAARRFENRLKRQKRGRGFFQLTGLDPKAFGGAERGS